MEKIMEYLALLPTIFIIAYLFRYILKRKQNKELLVKRGRIGKVGRWWITLEKM
jgi:hypothetical protein